MGIAANVSNEDSGPPTIHCSSLSEPVPEHLQANHVIYRTEPGVLVNSREPIGCGSNSQDMVSVALRIKLDTSKRDLISDEIVKVSYYAPFLYQVPQYDFVHFW